MVADGAGIWLRGLGDFENETLAAFVAGIDCGDFPVVGGRISIPFAVDGVGTGEGYFTERLLTQVSALKRDWGVRSVTLEGGRWVVPAVVGYRYASRGQLLRPVAQADTGAALGPAFAKMKRTHQFGILVSNTAGLKVGTSFDPARMHPLMLTDGKSAERALTPTELQSGIISDTIEDESSFDSQICWEVTGPFSAMVCAIGGFIVTEDK